MTHFVDKHRKLLFYSILILTFGSIYIYNLLTPYLSDDYAYLIDVRKAGSIIDLVRQQYAEYLSNSGRIIGQFNVRLSLYGSKQIFNVVNSLMFVALILLMYQNVKRKKQHLLALLFVITFVWYFTVEFGQTMLWICGSCNYLWGSVIILAFVTLYHSLLNGTFTKKQEWLLLPLTLFAGILAGWCNENTSGGGFLLVLIFSLNHLLDQKHKGVSRSPIRPYMVSGMAGMCLGMLGMVMAPGVRKRSATMSVDEGYTGIVGLLSRLYKVILNTKELFFVLLALCILVLVILALQRKLNTFDKFRTSPTILYLIAYLATAFVLALIPTPQNRAFFGAGVFLMIAVINGLLSALEDQEFTVSLISYSLAGVLSMWFFFTYVDNLVNLARIYREEGERIALIDAEHAEDEDGIVVIPQYRPEFRTEFSIAHDSDLTDDKEYWINHFYEIYYDIGNITAIPREEWDELYGNE